MLKRRALLVGYSGYDLDSGYLAGVQKDLKNFSDYLKSLKGGAWSEDEITFVQDKDLINLDRTIDEVKRQNNDIVFTVFSGHGGYDKGANCRKLEISKTQTVLEKQLWNLAEKQILVCDCCANIIREKEYRFAACEAIAKNSYNENDIQKARQKYDSLCTQCPPQFLKFYACQVGESANDTEEGGMYSVNLLRALKITNHETDIVKAHEVAREAVVKVSYEDENYANQTPNYVIPRIHPFLPGAIDIGGIKLWD